MPRPIPSLPYHAPSVTAAGNRNGNSNANVQKTTPTANSSNNGNLRNSARASSPSTLAASPLRTFSRLSSSPRTNSRVIPAPPFITTRAQNRRRSALLAAGGIAALRSVRSVAPADTDDGPRVTIRTDLEPTTTTDSYEGRAPSSGLRYTVRPRIVPVKNSNRRRPLTTSVSGARSSSNDNRPPFRVSNSRPSSGVGVANSSRVIRTARRTLGATASSFSSVPAAQSLRRNSDNNDYNNRDVASTFSIFKVRRPPKVSFELARDMLMALDGKDSATKVLMSDKILPRILRFMNWNELLPLRAVCKPWFEMIESHSQINAVLGIIVIRNTMEAKMAIYNASAVTWKKFRFLGPVIFDMAKPIQNEFWNKHGPLLVHLEISNRAMSLTGLVEILARCPRLEVFKCSWTPEMYSFNSELIRKYYGIHFNNGTFANLKDLTIDSSSSLTDTALWSILKWCGGSVRSLTLTSPAEEDLLTRLKPRWSVESIKSYFDRFGYTRNLQYLDFSWSNVTAADIKVLCSMDIVLHTLILNYCKLDDEILRGLLTKHGSNLEVFKVEGTFITDILFGGTPLPKVKVLHIGGMSGSMKHLDFLKDMPNLEELSCHNARWLEQSMLLKPFNSRVKKHHMKSLDLSGGIKHGGNKNLDPNLSKTWFSDFTGLLSNLRELNLSQWSMFGTNMNFRNICQSFPLLESLIVREWGQLSDVGTTGLEENYIHQDWGDRMPIRPRTYIGSLKGLKILDLSGTAITDATVNLALCSLKNLRHLAIEDTRITDTGLHALIEKIPSLDRISTARCTRISVFQPRLKRHDGRMVLFGKI